MKLTVKQVLAQNTSTTKLPSKLWRKFLRNWEDCITFKDPKAYQIPDGPDVYDDTEFSDSNNKVGY